MLEIKYKEQHKHFDIAFFTSHLYQKYQDSHDTAKEVAQKIIILITGTSVSFEYLQKWYKNIKSIVFVRTE